MPDNDRELVLEIYDTVDNPSRLPEILDKLREAVSARGFIIFDIVGEGADQSVKLVATNTDYDREMIDKYLALQGGQFFVGQDVIQRLKIENDDVELIDDIMVREANPAFFDGDGLDLVKDLGIRHWATAFLDKANLRNARCSVQFSAEHGDLTTEKRERIGEFLAHVAKAMMLGRPLRQAREKERTMANAIDQYRIGVCILDQDGRVVTSNTEFRRQIEAYNAYRIGSDGKLELASRKHDKQLQKFMADVFNHGKYGARPFKEAIVVGPRSATATLCIDVAPFGTGREGEPDGAGGVQLHSLDTSLPMPIDSAVIQQAFNLTKTERLTVEMICQGLTNPEIAEKRGRSVNTVDSQVKSVLDKMHCKGRAQLVQVLHQYSLDMMRHD